MEYNYITWNIIIFTYSVLCLVKSQFPPDMFPPGMMEADENAPVLDTTPQSITITQGQTAVLPCHVQNAGDTEVSWFTSEYVIISTGKQVFVDDGDRVSVDTSTAGEWNLVIENVQPKDQDKYKCMLQTFPPQTKILSLYVNAPPSIDKESLMERYLFQKGGSLLIMCKVEGNPEPFVTWYAYKTKSSSMEEVKELVSSSSTLVFEDLQPSDGGIYRCEAHNTVGTDMYEIFIQEVYEPRMNTTMKTVGVKEHSSTVLQCEIESNPPAKIGWQRDGHLIRTDAKYNIAMFAESETKIVTELIIRYTETSDSGEYVCVASNSYGNNNIRYYVIVEAPTTTTESTTTTTTRKPKPIVLPTTDKVQTSSKDIYSQQPEGTVPEQTTPSQVKTDPEEPKTGASLNEGYINTQCYTLILLTCTIALLPVS